VDASAVPTRETLAFLDAHLGPRPLRVLEVGCGAGEVAAALLERGHTLLALEADTASAERARARGVDVCAARFPEGGVPPGPFDAVFLGRVLHHLPALDAALDALHACLSRGGVLCVEDYAWERVERPTAAWVQSLLADLAARGGRPQDDWDLARDPLAAWVARTGDEGLHSAATMEHALARRFELAHVEDAPYAYRWSARYLPRDVAGCEEALAAERTAIEIGAIAPIGWRAVARRG